MYEYPAFNLDLDGRTGSVRRARRATARFLMELASGRARWLDEETRRNVVLVVSELVCNACRHAPGPCRLTVSVIGRDAVDIAVEDTSPRPPSPRRTPDPSGYGLRLVAGLSRGVHVVLTGTGKIVYATVGAR